MLKPLRRNVLIDPDPQPEASGGILMPQYRDWIATSGTVLACGPLVVGIVTGDRVVFSPEVGTRVFEGGREYLLLIDEDVSAVVQPGVTAEFVEANA